MGGTGKILLAGTLAVAVLAGVYVLLGRGAPEEVGGAGNEATGAAMVAVDLPDTLNEQQELGKLAFEAKCATCHGINAAGRDGAGPPLVHKIYEPGHHGDASFFLAVRNGVRPHHWKFGPMLPIDGLTDADIGTIVAYVRTLQRANGIE